MLAQGQEPSQGSDAGMKTTRGQHLVDFGFRVRVRNTLSLSAFHSAPIPLAQTVVQERGVDSWGQLTGSLPTLLFIFTSSPGSFLTFTPGVWTYPPAAPPPPCYVTKLNLGLLLLQLSNWLIRMWWSKAQHQFAGHQARRNGGYCWRPGLLSTFQQGSIEEATLREVCRALLLRDQLMDISLIGGEVTGWCFGNLPYQPSVPASLGSTCLWSTCNHHWGCVS